MCGLVGIAGKLEYRDEATMKRLLLFDFFRGPDSTGFAALRKDGSVKLAKMASHPIDFFDSKKFQEALSGHTSSVFLGHNRLATRGAVNGFNAHPYQFGHIVGAHNGSLDKSSHEALQDAVGEKFEVDSQAIFAAIEKLGIEETVPLLQGAWALTWFDLKEGTLNFLRNKERPFWYSYEKTFSKIFWASEWPMIEAATSMSAQTYDLYVDRKGHSFFATEVDWWYRFDLEELSSGSIDSRHKPKVKMLKGKEPAPAAASANGYSPFHRTVGTTTTGPTVHGQTTSTTTTTQSTTYSRTSTGGSGNSSVSNVLHLMADRSRPLAGAITKEKFDELAKNGCSFCSADVAYEDIGVTVNTREGYVLCPSCSDNTGHSRVYVTDFDKAKTLALVV